MATNLRTVLITMGVCLMFVIIIAPPPHPPNQCKILVPSKILYKSIVVVGSSKFCQFRLFFELYSKKIREPISKPLKK